MSRLIRLGHWYFQFLNPFRIIDLSLKLASRPTGIDRFSLVKGASLLFFQPKEQPIMGPGKFWTQCVHFLINAISRWAVLLESSNSFARILALGYCSASICLWNHRNLSDMIFAGNSFSRDLGCNVSMPNFLFSQNLPRCRYFPQLVLCFFGRAIKNKFARG